MNVEEVIRALQGVAAIRGPIYVGTSVATADMLDRMYRSAQETVERMHRPPRRDARRNHSRKVKRGRR